MSHFAVRSTKKNKTTKNWRHHRRSRLVTGKGKNDESMRMALTLPYI